ncbi:MAG: ATP-binding protein [Treponemataceae bacterium]|nr:ATP-binding protein [Treponemataceae bacterium]
MNDVEKMAFEYIMLLISAYITFRSWNQKDNLLVKNFTKYSVALTIYLAVNVPARLLELEIITWSVPVVFSINAVYMVCLTCTSYEWFNFSESINETFFVKEKAGRIISMIPIFVTVVLTLATIKTGWLFYISQDGAYHRGSLFFMQLVPSYSYMLATTISSICNVTKCRNPKSFQFLLVALLPTIIISFLQILFGGSCLLGGLTCVQVFSYIELCMGEIARINRVKDLKEIDRQIEQEIESENAANKAKTTFISNMSHDIKTPMGAAKFYTKKAEENLRDKEKLLECLDQIEIASNVLLNLVNNVLAINLIDSGEAELKLEKVNLRTFFNELLIVVKTSADEKHIEMNFDVSDLVHENVYCDKLRLNRILLNLTGNAVKFTESGGKVWVSAREIPGSDSNMADYVITVRDNGIGMTKGFKEKIFEPFARETSSVVRGTQGTGLGMAITKRFVDLMGGSISVESELDGGTEFQVRLPLGFAEEEVEKKPAVTKKASRKTDIMEWTKGKRILLVEDNLMNQEIAVDLLEDAGFVVDVVSDGLECVKKIKKMTECMYDLILMDIQMPVMDGYEATRQIRRIRDKKKSSVPIIAVTANAFEEDKAKALAAGMNGHLAKPIDLNLLFETIRTFV